MRLTDLADGLRKHGLTVVEEPGWKTRGASGGAQMKGVRGVLWHHDVAPAKGTYPLRAMLRDGRAGLSGPLCHLGFDRDGVVHVVGAGKANHAGKGKVPGVPQNCGNTYLIGIEMTSTGRGDWTDAQLREMPKLGAALSRMYGLSADQHWGHKDYTSRKNDPYGLPGGMPGLRSRIRAALAGKATQAAVQTAGKVAEDRPWKTSKTIRNLTSDQVKEIQRILISKGYDLGSYGADGSYGEATFKAVTAFQKANGLAADGVAGSRTISALRASQPAQAAPPAAPAKPSAPAFPLPRRDGANYYYGPSSGPITSVSGKGENSAARNDVVKGSDGRWYSKGLQQWQKAAGISADGRYGDQTAEKVRELQRKYGKTVDGKIGPDTWSLAWR